MLIADESMIHGARKFNTSALCHKDFLRELFTLLVEKFIMVMIKRLKDQYNESRNSGWKQKQIPQRQKYCVFSQEDPHRKIKIFKSKAKMDCQLCEQKRIQSFSTCKPRQLHFYRSNSSNPVI